MVGVRLRLRLRLRDVLCCGSIAMTFVCTLSGIPSKAIHSRIGTHRTSVLALVHSSIYARSGKSVSFETSVEYAEEATTTYRVVEQ